MHTSHNQQPDETDELAGDLLVGASAIAAYLAFLGVPDPDVYYMRRARTWPIGKTSDTRNGTLIASKRRLARHAQKITSPAV
jgi:hypothetical protein